MSGAFKKFGYLQPLKPNLFCQFPIIFTFILRAIFLLPKRANIEKRELQIQIPMSQRSFSSLGIGNELYSLNLTAAPLVVKIGISLLYG